MTILYRDHRPDVTIIYRDHRPDVTILYRDHRPDVARGLKRIRLTHTGFSPTAARWIFIFTDAIPDLMRVPLEAIADLMRVPLEAIADLM